MERALEAYPISPSSLHSGKLSSSQLAVMLNIFSDCSWRSTLVLSGGSDSKELCVLRTLKLWLEKKKKKPILHFVPDGKIKFKTVTLFQKARALPHGLGSLCKVPQGPYIEMRTIRRPVCSHNWSTFIRIKGWESLKLLTVQCFYSSHLPHTYCFQISPNWITESRPNDLSCPSTIYHVLFEMHFIIKRKYSLNLFSIL